MQSRGRQAEGRMIEGFGSNRFVKISKITNVKTQNDQNFAFCRKSVSMQPVSSSFSVLSRPSPSIPYRCPWLPKNNWDTYSPLRNRQSPYSCQKQLSFSQKITISQNLPLSWPTIPTFPHCSHYTSKGVVSVPRYHYNGGPAVSCHV